MSNTPYIRVQLQHPDLGPALRPHVDRRSGDISLLRMLKAPELRYVIAANVLDGTVDWLFPFEAKDGPPPRALMLWLIGEIERAVVRLGLPPDTLASADRLEIDMRRQG